MAVSGLTLSVRVSARRRRFALTVEQDARLTLHAPVGRSAGDAEAFVHAHHAWVLGKLALRERTRPLHPTKRLIEGEVFRYLGRTYRLTVLDEAVRDHRVRLVAGRLVLDRTRAEDPKRGRAALVDWYCRTGTAWAAGRLQPWAARMGVPEPRLDVRDVGTRWGRYVPGERVRTPGAYGPEQLGAGRMSLGWSLFQLPMHLVDYVIAHELAHVRVAGHGADFWRLLGLALPEYAQRRAELDELGRHMWMGGIEHESSGVAPVR
ncbi:hypothetical protein AN216_23960 [Streptomyces oceani]|uniref:YgjP-like metallopeptidase domain-containing protein n=1 Tax=Streptomyces oceani TaxID=1075402 RepID=A0A1E7JVX2_9ACTN|nr:hypothetical protein AN216_23960 [Streptomyces oceani]